jgi:hypothetical protein
MSKLNLYRIKCQFVTHPWIHNYMVQILKKILKEICVLMTTLSKEKKGPKKI